MQVHLYLIARQHDSSQNLGSISDLRKKKKKGRKNMAKQQTARTSGTHC